MNRQVLSAIMLFIGMTVSAQNVQFGVKAGVNFATLTGDDVDNADSKTAYHVGVLAEILFSDKFSVQPELLYSAQGISENLENPELKLNYLQLPIMAKYYVTDGLSLEVGPQLGLLLTADAEVEGEGGGDVKDFMNDFDFGLNIGVGYLFQEKFSISARYNLGLAKVFKDDFFGGETKAYNSVFQISLAYLFN